MYELIIIGAGPAGITASIYAARKKMKMLVIGKEIGGQVTKTSIIENYTGYREMTGEELARKFKEHMQEFNFEHHEKEVAEVKRIENGFKLRANGNGYECRTLIAATGAKPRMLDIPGEEEFKNKGVTYCATCDAPLFSGKDVAVIGGGNSALETALQLTKIANKIYIVNISENFTGDKVLADRVLSSDKVKLFNSSKATEIIGDKLVRKIKIDSKGEEKEVEVGGVFVNIGWLPNSALFKEMAEINERGEINISADCSTTCPGLFAAGDCSSVPYKQIGIAAGEGAKAALSAFKYLSTK